MYLREEVASDREDRMKTENAKCSMVTPPTKTVCERCLVRQVVWNGQEGFMEEVAANKALKDRMTWQRLPVG